LKTEFPRAPRLAADARPQPSARNVRFGSKSVFARCPRWVRNTHHNGRQL